MCLFRLKLILFMLLHFIRFLSVKIYVKDGIEKKRTEIKRKIKKKNERMKRRPENISDVIVYYRSNWDSINQHSTCVLTAEVNRL